MAEEIEQISEKDQLFHTRRILACSSCTSFLRKFNQGQYTIAQICQFFQKKYKATYKHIMPLRKAKLIEAVEMGEGKRLLFTISGKGKLALIEKGD